MVNTFQVAKMAASHVRTNGHFFLTMMIFSQCLQACCQGEQIPFGLSRQQHHWFLTYCMWASIAGACLRGNITPALLIKVKKNNVHVNQQSPAMLIKVKKQRSCQPTVPSNIVQYLLVMLDTVNKIICQSCFNIAGEH